MSAFIQELIRTGVYKRSQGRITRQVTFAAIVITVAVGLWRLSQAMVGVDPIVVARPAQAFYHGNGGRAASDARVKLSGAAGSAEIAVRADESLKEIAQTIDAQRHATGVAALLQDDAIRLSSVTGGADALVKVEVVSGAFEVEGVNNEGTVRGRNAIDLGLRFLVPGAFLVAGIWITYRAVNVPSFADFLIAVEAEINKVSWPSRGELVRASIVVLVVIFVLAAVLAFYDAVWRLLFTYVIRIF